MNDNQTNLGSTKTHFTPIKTKINHPERVQITPAPIPLFPELSRLRKHNQKSFIKKKKLRRKTYRQRHVDRAKKICHGARLVLNNQQPQNSSTNTRTCLLDAIVSIIPTFQRNSTNISTDILNAMPPVGDTSVNDIESALARNDLQLDVVSRHYHIPGGAAHNLLKEDSCALLISILLTNTQGKEMSHFVSWNGDVIFDNPFNVKVSKRRDCLTVQSSKQVFTKLYPKTHFKSWQITSIYSLTTIIKG